jgi:hypothetical protein
MTAKKQSLPLPVRLMNLAGAGAARIGFQPIELSVDSRLEKAEANTGLTDFDKDFIKDQVGSVRRAYQHFGFDLSDDAANAMQSFLDDNPADKHGKHLYSFEDIGMDEQRVREMFHEYQSYFDIPVEAV